MNSADDLFAKIDAVLNDGMDEIRKERDHRSMDSTLRRAVKAAQAMLDTSDSSAAQATGITYNVDSDTLHGSVTITVRTQRAADRLANRLEDLAVRQEQRT